MTDTIMLSAVSQGHFALQALPDLVTLPQCGARRPDPVEVPLEQATLDDIAFAIQGVEAEFNAVGDRLCALRQLYGLARDAGALGAERALEAVAADEEVG